MINITEESSAKEIDKQLQETFGIHLSFGDLFNIRKTKIIKHLEKWKLEEPLEFSCFKDLKWKNIITTSEISSLNIEFDNLKISFLRRNAENNIVIWVNYIVFRKLRIYESGRIIPDDEKESYTQKVLNFLSKSHLVNKDGYFIDSIWK